MARVRVEVLVRSVSGTAACGVCGTLFSWTRGPRSEDLDTLVAMKCPGCKSGDVDVHEKSIYVDMEVVK